MFFGLSVIDGKRPCQHFSWFWRTITHHVFTIGGREQKIRGGGCLEQKRKSVDMTYSFLISFGLSVIDGKRPCIETIETKDPHFSRFWRTMYIVIMSPLDLVLIGSSRESIEEWSYLDRFIPTASWWIFALPWVMYPNVCCVVLKQIGTLYKTWSVFASGRALELLTWWVFSEHPRVQSSVEGSPELVFTVI